MNYYQYLGDYWPEEDNINIDEPLKEVPFSSFTHRLGDKNIENYINSRTSIFGYFRRKHFFTRASDRFWGREWKKEFKKEEATESQPDV